MDHGGGKTTFVLFFRGCKHLHLFGRNWKMHEHHDLFKVGSTLLRVSPLFSLLYICILFCSCFFPGEGYKS